MANQNELESSKEVIDKRMVRIVSEMLFLDSLKPSEFLRLTNPKQYKKEMALYRKTGAHILIKKQSFFV